MAAILDWIVLLVFIYQMPHCIFFSDLREMFVKGTDTQRHMNTQRHGQKHFAPPLPSEPGKKEVTF